MCLPGLAEQCPLLPPVPQHFHERVMLVCEANDCCLVLLGIILGLGVQGAGRDKIHSVVGYMNIQPLNLSILVVVMLLHDVAVLWDVVHHYFDLLGNTGLKF